MAAAKPNSNFGGVQIGAITYTFRALPSSAEQILGYCIECGIGAVEMMNTPAEVYAGAPAGAGRGGPGGPAGAPGGAGRGRGQAGAGAPGQGAQVDAPNPAGQARTEAAPGGARGGGGRAQATPEQQAAQQKAADEMKKWRLSVSMDKYKALRKMYNDAGVSIYAFKLGITLNMADDECDYIFNVTKALGGNHVTMELPTDPNVTKRVGEFADKHKLMVGYHAHTQATDTLWDVAMSQSKYNGINFDIGHYVAGSGQSPIPLIQKHHDRITSLHLKDRKTPEHGGQNVPWGQGDTPIKEVLQLMKKEKYKFPASIEYEYNTPEGSDVLAEVKKCVAYAKAALA
jgi:sugar phosphate isomerase/epimerase